MTEPGVVPVAPEEPVICSARGCAAPASWALLWNNPKLHTPERRKTWVACADHKVSLSDFLGARGFLRDVVEHAGPAQGPDQPSTD